jgi:hypothetical protein
MATSHSPLAGVLRLGGESRIRGSMFEIQGRAAAISGYPVSSANAANRNKAFHPGLCEAVAGVFSGGMQRSN